MKELYRKCPVCDSTSGIVLHTIKMKLPENVTLPNEYDVVCCDNCGFTYADVNASQVDYNSYYETHNVYSADAALKAKIIGNRYMMRCRILSQYTERNAKILDVGFGAGGLLQYLKGEGFCNLCGIDPSARSVAMLKENGIDGYILNVFDDIPEEWKKSFDVVIFTAVLEHIYDLNLCIEQLEGYLNKHGILYIEVPAVEGFEKVYQKIPNYFNCEHINYFSVNSLDNLFANHGFIRKNSDSDCLCAIKAEEPVITAIYGKTQYKPKLIKDEISKRSIEVYLKQAKEKEREDYERILKFLGENHSRVVVWGTGAYAMQIVNNIPNLMEKIEFFIDSNELKTGTLFCGKMIYGPDKLNEIDQCYPILVCAMHNYQDIEETIKKMGAKNPYFIA